MAIYLTDDLLEACEAVIQTVLHGETYGLTEAEQLEACRSAARVLEEAMAGQFTDDDA